MNTKRHSAYIISNRRTWQNITHTYLNATTPTLFLSYANIHTHTHTRFTALCPGLPGWAGTRKVQPIWILLKQETVNGCGISWAICKSAPRSRQITMPAPHHSFFTGRMLFLPPYQQRQSTEGNYANIHLAIKHKVKARAFKAKALYTSRCSLWVFALKT